MRSLYFSSVGGASGDMILGTLISLGVDRAALEAELKKLLPGEDFSLEAVPVVDGGFSGVRAKVVIHEKHHNHHHHEGHDEHEHSHVHRHLADIRSIIDGSALPDVVKTMAVDIFVRLAEAEARIHGTTPEKIHFHEVGAVDSIVDIVGCCLARHWLGVDTVGCGPLPQGCGTMTCAHGIIPIPAPATVELLRGMKITRTEEPFELVTPTGAALLAVWSEQTPVTSPTGRIISAGIGFGQRRLQSRPNLLRAELMDVESGETADSCVVLECNIDDCNPEITATVFDKLLRAGALDVFAQPVMMKKQRQGLLLSVLCDSGVADTLTELIFRETTTFGVRRQLCTRTKLDRRLVEVDTPCGRVRVKIGSRNGRDLTVAPEYEDCAAAAERSGVPLKEVYRLALLAAPAPHGDAC